MLFQIYGDNAGWQLFGWLLVFAGLILANEIARRTKAGGIFCFLILPAALTVYFIAIYVGAAQGAEWALNNPTYTHMNSWFHYAKLYAATAGCIGFMMLKYKWSIGKKEWFKVFPFLIVAINILIAVVSDFESGIRGAMALAEHGDRWWLSSENVWLYGGWWNWVNGIAGILNILCMTGWWGIYSSKDKKDMLWPDMTFCFIIAYDLWNFEYTYNNLPTHAWYCGLALLLAPTFANALWNKGGWIQNRANTLALWCMFAQVFPLFQDESRFTTISSVYADGRDESRRETYSGRPDDAGDCGASGVGRQCGGARRHRQESKRAEEEPLPPGNLYRPEGFQAGDGKGRRAELAKGRISPLAVSAGQKEKNLPAVSVIVNLPVTADAFFHGLLNAAHSAFRVTVPDVCPHSVIALIERFDAV